GSRWNAGIACDRPPWPLRNTHRKPCRGVWPGFVGRRIVVGPYDRLPECPCGVVHRRVDDRGCAGCPHFRECHSTCHGRQPAAERYFICYYRVLTIDARSVTPAACWHPRRRCTSDGAGVRDGFDPGASCCWYRHISCPKTLTAYPGTHDIHI